MPLPPDWSRLEQGFKNAIGGLSNYKRRDAYEYVNALKKRIEEQAKEIDELGTHIASRSSLPPTKDSSP